VTGLISDADVARLNDHALRAAMNALLRIRVYARSFRW
jgi:hypothetical protein